jgi:rare lipoprotein A
VGRTTTASPRVIADDRPIPKGGGAYKVGEPYQIEGQWFVPREEPAYDRSGVASYYAEDFHGRRTSNGEIFDMWALTAAHPTLPLPSYVYVTNLANGRTLLVRVNDRGPYARSRVIDVSRATARYLGFETQGTAQVRVRYAGRAPLSGEDRNEQRFLASQSWFRVALSRAPAR